MPEMKTRPPLDELRRIYADTKTIAVVGASPDTTKRAQVVPSYLQDQGYRIIPVNPRHDEIFGEKAYPTLLEIPEQVDVVDVFRPAEETPAIAANAVEIGAKVLWLQLGIISEEAAQIAADGGLTVVMDHCMGLMHLKLGLGEGPDHH
ncbi:MAG: CoA-binding protein [Acidimicrobiia bacterium]|nr:MAG: CoA-binding protein [Acidimicrobiia bacterium]